MAEKNIELKAINDLLGMNFFIPSYQRGYRWTEQQVQDLLEDIDTFEPQEILDENSIKIQTFYCLQPLVVKKMSEDDTRLTNVEKVNNSSDWYEVIDGQQRLTTIYILLNILDSTSQKSLRYETRPNSNDFLKNIVTNTNDDNIDFHFMLEAKKTITDWKKDGVDYTVFLNKLKDNCKVIWYEIDDQEVAYDVFKRLNSGKIALSNAELVKALLLKEDNFNGGDKERELTQLEMAGEWDRMEQTLHDDSFWYFINPDPENARYGATRMDFVLEMILRCEKIDDVDVKILSNNYFIFGTYNNLISSEKVGWKCCWTNIQCVFRTMKAWFDNREWYHYIGYLMNLKGDDKTEMLVGLLKNAKEQSKSDFLLSLKNKCKESLSWKNNEYDISSLEYGKNHDNDNIHNILLLFNLATTQNQISEQSRYPFDLHHKEKWSLEHIHAQNERKAEWAAEDVEKIQHYLRTIQGDHISELANFLTTETLKDPETYNAVIGAFMGQTVQEIINTKDKTVSYSSAFDKDDSLGNMALLQGDKNAAFNNKLYPEKRAVLSEYENAARVTAFVPICTRNVFFKHYAPESANPFLWDKEAETDYLNAMVSVVSKYIGVSELKDNDIKIGFKK